MSNAAQEEPVATLEEMGAINFTGVNGAVKAATMPQEEWIGFYRSGMLAAFILEKSKPELMELVRRLCEPDGGDDAFTGVSGALEGAEHLFRGFMNAASGAQARLLSAAASVALAEEAGA